MKLTDDKKAALFKSLASTTLYEAGVNFGLDKHYKDAAAVRNKVYTIYKEVSHDPQKYFIQVETAELVVAAVSGRKIAAKVAIERVTPNPIVATDIKSLTIGGRDSAGRLIAKKLEYLEAHPKALEKESLVNLGKIFGILFDKGQIIQGQATEHVAVMSKIEGNMTPEAALDALLRGREAIMVDKHG